jgi:hypothetical protein
MSQELGLSTDQIRSLRVQRYCFNVERTMECPLLKNMTCALGFKIIEAELLITFSVPNSFTSYECRLEQIELASDTVVTPKNSAIVFRPLKGIDESQFKLQI